MALPGVAITNIKANPPLRAIIIAASNGLISGISVAIAIPIGSNIATAPIFDIMFVSKIVRIIITNTAINNDCIFLK